MIFDSDVVIWALRGNRRAVAAIDRADTLELSVVSYIEIVQGARDKTDLRQSREYLAYLEFAVLPLSESIGLRASVYIEEYALKSGLRLPDALIAATAAENQIALCSGNIKHYRSIAELDLVPFRPV